MMKIDIKFNSEGFRQILVGDGVKSLIEDTTKGIAERANANLADPKSEGYRAEVFQGAMVSKYGHGGRWIGYVIANDRRASADEAENKSLSRAVK